MTTAAREITTTITQRGQVTIPAEVRRVLGIKPRDKVTFTVEDGHVRLTPTLFTLESAYGSVKPSKRPEDFEEVSRVVKEAKVQQVVHGLRSPRQ